MGLKKVKLCVLCGEKRFVVDLKLFSVSWSLGGERIL
jgi:hypothetical protein